MSVGKMSQARRTSNSVARNQSRKESKKKRITAEKNLSRKTALKKRARTNYFGSLRRDGSTAGTAGRRSGTMAPRAGSAAAEARANTSC
jgi:hypothetical protein